MTASWTAGLRSHMKQHRGFTVTNDRGRVRLQYRRTGYPTESAALPFTWDDGNWTDAAVRIDNIVKAHRTGADLATAVRGVDTASSRHVEDWAAALTAYRQGPQQRLKDVTWAGHLKVINIALQALQQRNAPTNGADLMDTALKGWTLGTRQHQQMRQRLQKFLSYCVQRHQFKATWLPPEGRDIQSVKPKRIGYPLSDTQILRLLDALPETAIGRRYRFAYQLLATYGLRPEDLNNLQVRNGGTELWSGYEKSKGGTSGAKTEPRRLYALSVRDIDGTPQDWNLLQRVALGEELPPLGNTGEAGQRLYVYLKDKPVWHSIQAEAAAEGQQAVIYSFRHRYAYTAHNRPMANGLMRSPKQCADAMGHDLQTHLKSYARFQTRDLAAAFDEAVSVAPSIHSNPHTQVQAQ